MDCGDCQRATGIEVPVLGGGGRAVLRPSAQIVKGRDNPPARELFRTVVRPKDNNRPVMSKVSDRGGGKLY
jgi:hypothetical protein